MPCIKHSGFKHNTLEAYAYLLDFNNAFTASNSTHGERFSGVYPAGTGFKILCTMAYARSVDYAGNPLTIDEDYFPGVIGGSFNAGVLSDPATVKFDFEPGDVS